MFRLELKNGKEWVPLVTIKSTEATEKVFADRGRKKGVHYRFVDLSKPQPAKRVAKASEKPSEATGEVTPKPRATRAKKAAQNASESTKEGAK